MFKVKRSLDFVADIVLIIVAVCMLGLTVAAHRSRPARVVPRAAKVPDNWRAEINTGIRMGARHGKVTIIEFIDFQCPFCARWAARVDSLQREFPDEVQVVFQHFPLTTIHPHSLEAAIAAECADQQGAFSGFQNTVFAKQREIGSTPWREFATQAGVKDIQVFDRCASSSVDSFPRIKHGLELAAKLEMNGTPTVWINGVSGQPTLADLRRIVQALK